MYKLHTVKTAEEISHDDQTAVLSMVLFPVLKIDTMETRFDQMQVSDTSL